MKRAPRWLTGVCVASAAALATLTAPGAAQAYSTASIVSDPCHEWITWEALRRVRADFPNAAPLAATANERALIDDVPFDLDSDMRDLAAATIALGNRDVDLKGNEPDDLDQLAPIHGNPNTQQEHCLRAMTDDEPEGSLPALDRCQEQVRGWVLSALDGLTSDGTPDPAQRLEIEVVLDLRGSVHASLPRYYVEMGRAFHTLQDGFSHSYRNADDQTRVTTLLNYIELAEEILEERRDGPPHSAPLDRCLDLDDFRRERFELAMTASYELMRATLDNTRDRASKEADVDDVLNRYLSFDQQAACTFDNGWCDAKEATYADEGSCVCTAPRAPGAPFGGLAFAVASGLLFAARRALRRRARLGTAAALAFGLAVALGASPARAQDPAPTEPPPAPPPSTPPPSDPEEPPTATRAPDSAAQGVGVVAVDSQGEAGAAESDRSVGVIDTTPDTPEKDKIRFGVVVAGGGALQNGAFAGSLGGIFRLNANWLFGLDGEYNPWFSVRNFDVKQGSTNVYASVVMRFPLRFQRVNLRSTLQLGVARMNFAVFGVPEGSIGPYVGFNLLGLDYELSRSIYVILFPAHIAIPIPKLSGVPFYYPQYRLTIGLQFGA